LRIVLAPVSATKRLPAASSARPDGVSNDPGRVVTLPSESILRMRPVSPASATNKVLRASRTTAKGSPKRAFAAPPSVCPRTPSPATLVMATGQPNRVGGGVNQPSVISSQATLPTAARTIRPTAIMTLRGDFISMRAP